MTGEHGQQPSLDTDKDRIEFLLFLFAEMKRHGSAWYARKMPADEKMFEAAKKRLNDYVLVLKKRGYNGDRFGTLNPRQLSML